MAGERVDFKPTYFEWNNFEQNERLEFPTSPLFFTESQLDRVSYYSDSFDCYLILVEPEALHPENYQRALELENDFVGIFTHDARYLKRKKWHRYPFGGSWIANPEITHKSLNVGMIASHKQSLPGHKLRHKVARNLTQHFTPHVWGSGYTPFDTKRRILADYRFMVIIENVRQDYWFTEKLLDALSMGCVAIYWGCPSIGEYFDTDGIIQFETFEELKDILNSLDFQAEYLKRSAAVMKNAARAKDFFICEDVLHNTYPTIFGENYSNEDKNKND